MSLQQLLGRLSRARELSREQLQQLSTAVFNLEETPWKGLAGQLHKLAGRFREAYLSGALGSEARHDYVQLLATLHNQEFFLPGQTAELLAWLREALSPPSAEVRLRQLEAERAALLAEIEAYAEVQKAVLAFKTWRPPGEESPSPPALEAGDEPVSKALAKLASKEPAKPARKEVKGVEWQVQTDGGWRSYDKAAQEKIRAAVESGHMRVEVYANAQWYQLDLEKMKQLNSDSGMERRIRVQGGERPQPRVPKLNFERLFAEFKAAQEAAKDLELLRACEPVEDSLLEWLVDLSFPEGSKLQESLETLAASMFDPDLSLLRLCLRFPPEFPARPPEVWLRRPRLKRAKGPISFGGRLRSTLLTKEGWRAETSVLQVLEGVRKVLLESEAEAETAVSVRREYPRAPAQLLRMSSELFPTANGFNKEGMVAISPEEAKSFLGDLARLEATDKIGLPFCCSNEIYSRAQQGAELSLPLIFEVRTALGRKRSCAIFEFVDGLPKGHVLLPKWLMDDLEIQEREAVRVRGSSLELISCVKVQPHSLNFYHAVRDSGVEVQKLLTESLSRFSALTEDTAVPITIAEDTYLVQVVECKPMGSVRIIDMDVQHHFEFEVDFEPAPDLEDESETQALQERLLQDWKLKREISAVAKQERDDRRREARACRVEQLRERFQAAVDAGGGGGAAVEVVLRLPDGSKLQRSFEEGQPAAALALVALGTDWALAKLPWGLHLRVFPNRVLSAKDLVTKDLHRAVVSVQEEEAPEQDEELLAVMGPRQLREQPAVVKEESTLEEAALPERDTARLETQTKRAFEVQRFLKAGYTLEEALERQERGEVLPPTAPGARLAPRPPPAATPQAARAMPQEAAALQRSLSEEEEFQKRVQEVMSFTGVDEERAERALRENDSVTESAVNSILDGLAD